MDMRNRIVTFKFKGQSSTGKTQNGYMKAGEDLESTTHIHQSRPVMPRVIIFTPCCMNKSDTEQIQQGSKVARPQDYLEDHELIKRLKDTRKRILDGLAKRKGKRICYPIDLYAGKAYIDLRNSGNKDKIKKTLLSTDNVQWFFLSAGYGVINALEEATDYDASFYDSEVRKMWLRAGLSSLCDAIVWKFNPSRIYIFGTPKYLRFIKGTNFHRGKSEKATLKTFEGFGKNQDRNAGLRWLAKKLKELAEAIMFDGLDSFDDKYRGQYHSNKKGD